MSPELLAQLERLELVSRKIFRGRMKGERRSTRKGQSVEFADFRNYVPGDDLRFIDWNTYARLDQLFLKMFLEEEDLHFYALIDASASMDFGTPTKLRLRQATGRGAGLHWAGARRSRADRNAWASRPAGPAPILRGRQSVWRMLDHLDAIEPGESRLAGRRASRTSASATPGKGIVVLDQRPDGQAGLRRRPSSIWWRSRWTCTSFRCSRPRSSTRTSRATCSWSIAKTATWPRSRVSAPLLKRYQTTLAAFVDGGPRVLHAAAA